MQTVATVWRRARSLGRRADLQRDLDEEMGFHRDMLARDLEHAGVPAGDAHDAAQRQFGNALHLRERSAEAWGFPSLDDIWHDVRFGARMLRRSPTFSLVAVAAIGVAIGINSGFFTLVDTFVWRPIPVVHPERLVKVAHRFANGGSGILFSYPEVQAMVAHSTTVEDVMPLGRCVPVALRSSTTQAARVAVPACVSGNYFSSLGGTASSGRMLSPIDDDNAAASAIVISDFFWTREFGRALDVVGRDVVINGSHATIVGVAKREFVGVIPIVPDFWMTLPLAARLGAVPGRLDDVTNRFIDLRARLRPGVSRERAEAELSGMFVEPKAEPGSRAEMTRVSGIVLKPNESAMPLDTQTALLVAPALLVVALVLVIACANLANLLLSRALVRQREIAVRLALGASRRRLLRQLLTESLLIAIMGAALGLLLANWTVTVVSRAFFANVPSTVGTIAIDLQPSWHVVAYTAALAMLSVLIFGLTPALQATSPNLASALKGEDALFGMRVRRSRFRDGLVAVQVAACLVLLVASGTLVQSLRAFGRDESGLDARRVSVAVMGISANGHVVRGLDSARAVFASRVAALPDVAATARALHAPFTSWFPLLPVAASGDHAAYIRMPYNLVTPRYFDVVGQHLVSGRLFSPDDSSSGAPVAIVTPAAARRLWSGSQAIGQTLRVAVAQDEPDRIVRVVGVVSDAQSGMIWDWDASGYVYLPATRRDFSSAEMPLLVRSDARQPIVARAIEDIARDIDPNAPTVVEPLLAARATQLMPFRYGAFITSGVGAIGLGLALIGLYGIVSFAVAQRQRELAVRIALGAKRRDVLRLVLRREMRLVFVGLTAGLVMAAGEARLIESMLIPLATLGIGGLLTLAGLLLAVACLATLVPAAGALRISPMQVLRQD